MPASLCLHIDNPCHESWQQMTPDNDGRHCRSCQKTVIDFSTMSDQEILKHISAAGHSLCGRFTKDQLNREILLEEKKPLPFWRYTWNLIVATCLTMFQASGQSEGNPRNSGQQVVSKVPGPIRKGEVVAAPERKGIVLDSESKLPVAYATVTSRQTRQAVAADSLGRFTLMEPDGDTLRISAVGYEPQDILMSEQNTIYLKPAAQSMDDISVVGYCSDTKSYMLGGLSYQVKATSYQKVVRELKEYLPKKDVRIYPNPARAGSSVTLQLAFERTGHYLLELFSTTGQLIHREPLLMNAKTQIMPLAIHSSWAAGCYWIRISGSSAKKVYEGKLLVQ